MSVIDIRWLTMKPYEEFPNHKFEKQRVSEPYEVVDHEAV